MIIFLSIVILVLLAYLVYKEYFIKDDAGDLILDKIEILTSIVGVNNVQIADLKKDLTSRMLTIHEAIDKQDIAVLGQNKAVSELTTAYNLNTTNIKARLEKAEKAITNKSFDGIIEVDFSKVLNELAEIKKLIEAKEDAPIYVETK